MKKNILQKISNNSIKDLISELIFKMYGNEVCTPIYFNKLKNKKDFITVNLHLSKNEINILITAINNDDELEYHNTINLFDYEETETSIKIYIQDYLEDPTDLKNFIYDTIMEVLNTDKKRTNIDRKLLRNLLNSI